MTTSINLSILEHFQSKRIAVIGDLMLDIYHRGSVTRISPEAPVPVVNIDSVEYHPGGAANVAMNLRSLGADVDVFGVAGADLNGDILASELTDFGINIDGVVTDSNRPTTAKTRVIAGAQHVVRTDLEDVSDLTNDISTKLLDSFSTLVSSYDAVILQDYNKGVFTTENISRFIQHCCEHETTVTVDPKFLNFFDFQHTTLVKPNIREVENILGRSVKTDTELQGAGDEFIQKLDCKYLLVTLGARGMQLFTRDGAAERLPTQAKKVADVSGAGDTVIATVTLAMVSGAGARSAAILGNIAAGKVCEEVGIVPITRENLRNAISAIIPE